MACSWNCVRWQEARKLLDLFARNLPYFQSGSLLVSVPVVDEMKYRAPVPVSPIVRLCNSGIKFFVLPLHHGVHHRGGWRRRGTNGGNAEIPTRKPYSNPNPKLWLPEISSRRPIRGHKRNATRRWRLRVLT